MTIGPKAALKFFTKKRNYKGTGFFLGGTRRGGCALRFRRSPVSVGFALVLLGWAMTGMGVESYGFVLLFADFLPTALPFARKVPVLGYVLSLPPVRMALTKLSNLAKGRGEDRLPV